MRKNINNSVSAKRRKSRKNRDRFRFFFSLLNSTIVLDHSHPLKVHDGVGNLFWVRWEDHRLLALQKLPPLRGTAGRSTNKRKGSKDVRKFVVLILERETKKNANRSNERGKRGCRQRSDRKQIEPFTRDQVVDIPNKEKYTKTQHTGPNSFIPTHLTRGYSDRTCPQA